MKTLTFTEDASVHEGRRIRSAVFEERSILPVTAACVVANAIRESLCRMLAATVEIRLLAPVVPSVQAWHVLTSGAKIYRCAGTRTDAALIVRSDDCIRFAGAAFGEPVIGRARPLSELEDRVLGRMVGALAPALGSVCGAPGEQIVAEPARALQNYTSYFELVVEKPVEARIGIALAREPSLAPAAAIAPDDLLDLSVEVTVSTEGLPLSLTEVAAIEVGTIVPITVSSSLSAVASVAGGPIARGECGVRGNRLALAIGLTPPFEGSSEPES